MTTTGVCSHPALLCALSTLGEDAVMFSVDYPYEDCSVAATFIETAQSARPCAAKFAMTTQRNCYAFKATGRFSPTESPSG